MKIGLISGCSKQHIIIRASLWEPQKKLPKLGSAVSDSELKELGTISDIFGPASKPFFSISPKKSSYLSFFADKSGEPVYTYSRNIRRNSSQKRKTTRVLLRERSKSSLRKKKDMKSR
ncbi:MAG: hypothetical protein ACTSWY_13675 [Promethearchaeota archaeon]